MNYDNITKYLDSLVEGGLPSVDCMIYEKHKEVYRHYAGYADHERTVPIRPDQLYLVFSMTKIQTMTAIMQLIEQGKLSLEDEVGKYLPSYVNLKVKENPVYGGSDDGKIVPANKPLLIWHLLSMQSGLDYDLERPGIKRILSRDGQNATTRSIVDAIVESPLNFHPGEHFCYSLSHDVAAAIVEEISGCSFGEYLKKNIWDVLGMEHTFFGKPLNEELTYKAVGKSEGGKPWVLADEFIYDEANDRIVPMEPSCNYQLSEHYESGGAGLISSTYDYALLGDALASGGVGKDGGRILKPETIALMKKNLLCPESQKEIVRDMGRLGYGYGCGVQILEDPAVLSSPAPAGLFGWDGAAGSILTMDSLNERALVFTMHVRGYGPAYGQIHPRLRDLMYED